MEYRTIGPDEAELMWVILCLENELASEKRLPTAEEIGREMNGASVDMVRSMISNLNSGKQEYVSSSVRLKKKLNADEPKKRGTPPVTYRLAQMCMVQFPQTEGRSESKYRLFG